MLEQVTVFYLNSELHSIGIIYCLNFKRMNLLVSLFDNQTVNSHYCGVAPSFNRVLMTGYARSTQLMFCRVKAFHIDFECMATYLGFE